MRRRPPVLLYGEGCGVWGMDKEPGCGASFLTDSRCSGGARARPAVSLAETLIVRLSGRGALCGKVVRPLYLLAAFDHAFPTHRAPPSLPSNRRPAAGADPGWRIPGG